MYKVFIIDDEKEILDLLSKALSRNKELSVSTYSNPVQGVKAALSQKPDLVLTDIMMPEMDGIEVLEKIKGQDNNILVVMMTAYSTLDKVLNTHSKGAEHYIMKPFDSLKSVEDKIMSLLKKK